MEVPNVRRVSAVVGSFVLLAFSAPAANAAGDIVPTRNAPEIASAITSGANPDLVTDSDFVTLPDGYAPSAVSDHEMTGFATDGPSYAILSTGDPRIGPNKNDAPDSGEDLDGASFQGTDNHDVTMLRLSLDVPADADCLTFNYRFLSEEFNEFVGAGYNDTFLAQLDRSDWQAGNDAVYAPADFATAGASIGIDSTGDYAVTEGNAAGTTYDAATSLVTAKTRITPGAHTLFLTIFDQGDGIYDSAAFIDKLQVAHADPGNCEPPAISNPAIAEPVSPAFHDPPVSRIAKIGGRVKAKTLKAFSGSAAGDNELARVDIALVKVVGGAQAAGRRHRRAPRPRCVHMNAKRLMFQRAAVAGKCSRLEWVPAQGTTSWNFELKRKLEKGNYVLYSRAVDSQGRAEQSFSAAKGNRVSFSVR